MQYVPYNWKFVLWSAVIATLGLIMPAQRLTQAQSLLAGWADADQMENYKFEKSKPVAFSALAGVLRNGTFADADEEQKFADFYTLCVFPNITHGENRQAPRDDVVAKLRSNFKSCERAPSQDVFNKLTDLTLAYMTRIAFDIHFHPAVRVNAMLAIGEINAPKAAKVLLDTAFDRKQPFAIRVAAMTGLVRMAGPTGRIGGPGGQEVLASPEVEPLVVKDMVMFAGYHAAKKDDGICWMRGQAADILADMGSLGSKAEVPAALLKMLSDKELPIPLRSKAARALGKLKYGGSLPAASLYLKALAEFANDALSSEQPAHRGRARQVCRDVLDGLKPFAGSSFANDQKLIEGLQDALPALVKATENPLSPEDTKTAIANAKTKLDGIVENKR